MSQIAKNLLKNKYVCWTTHVGEIVRNYPTTIANERRKAAKEFQNIMMSKTFRVYTPF